MTPVEAEESDIAHLTVLETAAEVAQSSTPNDGPPNSSLVACDSMSLSKSTSTDQQKISTPRWATDVVTGNTKDNFSKQQWKVIMQLSFSHFKEQQALKALLLSKDLCHRNELTILRIEKERTKTLLRNKARTAKIAFEQLKTSSSRDQRALKRRIESSELGYQSELRNLRTEYEQELARARHDARKTKTDFELELAKVAEEARITEASLQAFKERNTDLTKGLRQKLEEMEQFENGLIGIRQELEQRATRIRELEWSEHRLQRTLAGMQDVQADSERQLHELTHLNTIYTQFIRSFEPRPEDTNTSAVDPLKQVGNCQLCILKEEQNGMLREVNYTMAEKIVETRCAAEIANRKMSSLQDLAENTPNEKKIRPQELIALRDKQLADLRRESSTLASNAKQQLDELYMETTAMKSQIASLESACEAKDINLAQARHDASQADSLKRKLAVYIDMATKKQNSRQVRKTVDLLNRERQCFTEEIVTLKAHSEAFQTLFSKAVDESVAMNVKYEEERRTNLELKEAQRILEKKFEALNIKHEGLNWRWEHHEDGMKHTKDEYKLQLRQRDTMITDMKSKFENIMSTRPLGANDQALALLDIERATIAAIKEDAQAQKEEIDRLRERAQRYGTYARRYEILSSHLEHWQHRIQSNMDEAFHFDAALFEQVRAQFGEATMGVLRRDAIRRYEEVKREREAAKTAARREAESFDGGEYGVIGEGREKGGIRNGKEREVERAQLPTPEKSDGEGSTSWRTCS